VVLPPEVVNERRVINSPFCSSETPIRYRWFFTGAIVPATTRDIAAALTAVCTVVLMLDVVNDAETPVMPALLLKMLPLILPESALVGNSKLRNPVDWN
jgi:hypothetical protein